VGNRLDGVDLMKKKTAKNTPPAEATEVAESGEIKVISFTSRRAKTPEQKAYILNTLLEIWIRCPQLRLGQLITMNDNAVELVYKEDLDLVDMLERMIKRYH
jgi:hypothetical protein